jgi:hypothetical protein
MSNTSKRIRTGLQRGFFFAATFLTAFSLGSATFDKLDYTRTDPTITRSDEPTDIPRLFPRPRPRSLRRNRTPAPFGVCGTYIGRPRMALSLS